MIEMPKKRKKMKKWHLMNIVLSPRSPRQCHGMLRDDQTVGLWCDRLIRVAPCTLHTLPHSDQSWYSVAEERRVTTGLLAKISQDERLHLTDQEGGTDESPTSTRNGAKMLVG